MEGRCITEASVGRSTPTITIAATNREHFVSYVGALMNQLAHIPQEPSRSEVRHNVDELQRKERVERELVATASHLGPFAEFHPTRARAVEELPKNLYRSNTGFFINKQAVEIKLDKK